MTRRELKALITLAGRVDPSLQAAMLKATGASSQAASKIRGHWNKLGQALRTGAAGFLKGITATVAAGTVLAVAAFGAMGSAGLQYASDLTEAQNVVDVTFQEGAAVIENFAGRALQAYGVTTLEAKQYASTMGAMLKSMGLAGEETLVMSQNLAALAGDMASFYNLDGAEAFEKIRAGISGETEPLKQLGINLSVANLEAYALSQGITASYQSMSQADQAVLRYNYLLAVTADAQGDFARTSGSFANQQRLLQASLEQTSGEIMGQMMPALATGMQQLNGMIAAMDTRAVGSFAGELANLAVQFLPLVAQLLPAFGSLLMAVMPALLQLGQAVIPVVVQVVQALVQAATPLIPPLLNLVQMILPPLGSLLQAVMPLVSALASLFSAVLAPAIGAVSAVLTPVCQLIAKFAGPIADLAGKIASIFTGSVAEQTEQSIEMSRQQLGLYAQGGFSARPAIFGEDGLEVAIPIKRTPRSLGLLAKTAQLLGVTQAQDNRTARAVIQYAPQIHLEGQPEEGVRRALRRGFEDFRRWYGQLMADQQRLAWE